MFSRSVNLINSSRAETVFWLSYVNIMVADALATCVASTAAPMILTM